MDPKLIQARAEIEAVLNKHDIAAHVILHNAPGNSEIFVRLTPTYSRLTVQAMGSEGVTYRLRSKAADYGGDLEAQRRDLAATANMVSSLAMILGTSAIPMLRLAQTIDDAVGAEHTEMWSTHGRGH